MSDAIPQCATVHSCLRLTPLCRLFPVRAAQVFELNPIKAWSAIAITLTSVAASLYLISVSPWYLLPFAWFIAGTAFTGVSLLCLLVKQYWPCRALFLSLGGSSSHVHSSLGLQHACRDRHVLLLARETSQPFQT